jgi:hypothetical protein
MGVQGRLGLASGGNDLIFDMNPSEMSRESTAQYANNLAGLTDYGDPYYTGPDPAEWVRNPPEKISFELVFHVNGIDKADNVENMLAKLRGFMRKSARTREPPDLLFKYGSINSRVRIASLRQVGTIYDAQLNLMQCRVRVELIVQENV